MLHNEDNRRTRLVLRAQDKWITFFSNQHLFISMLRNTISEFKRKYNKSTTEWSVYYTEGATLVQYARRFYDVDWSSLPDEWQLIIAGARVSASTESLPTAADEHTTLYVVKEAPFPVIRAAYEALVHMYHPDQNQGIGDPERLSEVMKAFKYLSEKNKN